MVSLEEKDVTEKILIALNEVFVGFFNVLVFGSKQVLTPDSLEDIIRLSQYKADNITCMTRNVISTGSGKGKESSWLLLCEKLDKTKTEHAVSGYQLRWNVYRFKLLKPKNKR